jgi:hypothetical protein
VDQVEGGQGELGAQNTLVTAVELVAVVAAAVNVNASVHILLWQQLWQKYQWRQVALQPCCSQQIPSEVALAVEIVLQLAYDY